MLFLKNLILTIRKTPEISCSNSNGSPYHKKQNTTIIGLFSSRNNEIIDNNTTKIKKYEYNHKVVDKFS